MIALFDHEECGSESESGAGGPVMMEALTRVALCFPDPARTATSEGAATEREALRRSIRKSFLISADVAHAIHPNWAGKHDENHAPQVRARDACMHAVGRSRR